MDILPKILPRDVTYKIHVHQGKGDLLDKLSGRLRGYSRWLPDNARVVVLVDQDNGDCKQIKAKLERCAIEANMLTRRTCGDGPWRIATRIAIEELEAWFFGEWAAVRAAFPRVSAYIPNQAPYRDPDAISGGTWEALERVLKRAGYFEEGLRKVEAARAIAGHFTPLNCTSNSFRAFRVALLEAVT